jgi:hypothetical protein
MTTTTYASDLGKCYNKTEDGGYRLYREDGKPNGAWVIYFVYKGDSGRLEAYPGGYLSDPDNFDIGVYELECESRELERQARAEFGF